MAVTVSGHTIKMTAAADTLNQATLGHTGALSPYKVSAISILISSGAGGACVLTNSGIDFVTFTMAANTLYTIVSSDVMELDNFTVTTLAAGYVVVFLTR